MTQASLPTVTIAADYLARMVPIPSRPAILSNYLVIEVALYPARASKLLVSSQHFSLRINGRKTVLLPQVPGVVAAELKYPDWEPGPQVAVGAGVGDATVVFGPRRTVQRFPGDPRAPRSPQPVPPSTAPGQADPPPASPDEFAREAALPEGEISQPIAGLLYFAFKGKTKAIRTLELIYSGPAGSVTLRLF